MSSVRHFVRDDQMVLGFDNHLHVVADHPRAPAAGSHRTGLRVRHRQLTVWAVFEPLLDVIQRAHLFVQTFDLVVEPIGPSLDLDSDELRGLTFPHKLESPKLERGCLFCLH